MPGCQTNKQTNKHQAKRLHYPRRHGVGGGGQGVYLSELKFLPEMVM